MVCACAGSVGAMYAQAVVRVGTSVCVFVDVRGCVSLCGWEGWVGICECAGTYVWARACLLVVLCVGGSA